VDVETGGSRFSGTYVVMTLTLYLTLLIADALLGGNSDISSPFFNPTLLPLPTLVPLTKVPFELRSSSSIAHESAYREMWITE
jgi:cytochrome c biogenesis factor